MELTVSVEDGSVKEQRQMWGTTRTLIANAIVGMTEGYSVPLYLVGVGFRANMEDDPRGTLDGGSGKRLHMKLGYTHSVYVPIPPYMKAEVPSATKISLFCTDKQLLGEFARKIKSLRMPEPYKGKVRREVACIMAGTNQVAGYFHRQGDYPPKKREEEVVELKRSYHTHLPSSSCGT